ncbi:MAG: YfhO family protein [Gemmatimonadota bacterium]|nr:YfhO family protein [Gemmatimonadota bacterium]
MKAHLVRALEAGEWAWWNPWIRNGLPFFANPEVGALYPFTLLFLAGDLPWAANWSVILHFLLLGSGVFAWQREEGRSPEAAVLASFAIAWGGTALSLSNLWNVLQSFAWAGWAWWCWVRWIDSGSRRWLGVTALVFVLQFLGGEPFVVALTALLALPIGWLRGGGARRSVGGLTVVAALSVATAALQLVPTAELFWFSERRIGLAAAEALRWSLHPIEAIGHVWPRTLTGPDGLFDMRAHLGPSVPWILTPYVGAIVAMLAAVGAGYRTGARSWFWLGVGTAGLVLALGRYNPLYVGVTEPALGTTLFRYPEKWLLLTAVAVPVLAARGLDSVRESAVARRRAIAVAAAYAVLAGLVAALLGPDLVERVASGWGTDHPAATEPARVVTAGRRATAHVLVALGIGGGILLWGRRRWRRGATWAVIAVAAVDLAVANVDAVPLAPSSLYGRTPEIVRRLPEEVGRTARVRTTPLDPEERLVRIPGTSITTQHVVFRDLLAPNLGMVFGVLHQGGNEAFRPGRVTVQKNILRAISPEERIAFLRLFGTRYLYRTGSPLPGLEPIGEPILGGRIFEVRDALPRAYLVRRTVVEPDSIALINRLLDEPDPGAVAYVREGPALDGPAGRVEHGIRWIAESNSRVTLEVDTAEPAFLVLTDSDYPGWRVIVDGRRRPLRSANWFFRGVELGPGIHTVEFAYRPRWIVPAATVSAVGLAVLLVTIAWGGGRSAGSARRDEASGDAGGA